MMDWFKTFDVAITRKDKPPLSGRMNGWDLARLRRHWCAGRERGSYLIEIDGIPTRCTFQVNEILEILGVRHEHSL